MAGVYEQMKRLPDAEATYKRGIALRPDYWDGYRALAEFYGRQKRVQDSIAQYRRIIELTPDNPEAYSDLGDMRMADSHSAAAAEAAFQKSIQLAPNYQAYSNLGRLYIRSATRSLRRLLAKLSNSTTGIGAFGPISKPLITGSRMMKTLFAPAQR